eukprot:4882721-Pleurochrysis_carterae.AAC.1
MLVVVLLVEVAGSNSDCVSPCASISCFFAVRCQMRLASASPYSGLSSFHSMGTPRSSKKRSSVGGRTWTSPSSPSNDPWR